MSNGIDEGFIRRVYITSGYVWTFGLLASWSVSGWRAALGWTVGSALSVGLLRAIEWFVRSAIRPGHKGARKQLLIVAIIHWPVLVAVLAGGLWLAQGNFPYIVAFCVGLVLTQIIIVLKVVGMLVNQYLNR
ncbi:MAG: hypothetical protein ACOX3G_01660 [Armatimonadota bacterium]